MKTALSAMLALATLTGTVEAQSAHHFDRFEILNLQRSKIRCKRR